MTDTNQQPLPSELDEALGKLVLKRATAINTALLARLATVANDLDAGGHRVALGGIDGLERQINTMRSLLLLLS